MTRGLRVAVLPIPAIGHVNPLLGVVQALAEHPAVSWLHTVGPAELREPFGLAGASHSVIDTPTLQRPPDPRLSDLAFASFVRPLRNMAEWLEVLRAIRPDVICYDVFSIYGLLAARQLGVASVSFLSFAGYGALGDDYASLHPRDSSELGRANAEYRDRFGCDVLGEGFLPVLFPARDLSLVGMEESLSIAAAPAGVLPSGAGPCAFVGPCYGSVRMPPQAAVTPRPAEPGMLASGPGGDEFAFTRLEEARIRGQQIIVFSLGTVLTDFRFDSPVGGAPSGRAYLLRMLAQLVEAFGDRPELLLVVAVGSRLGKELPTPRPRNFVVTRYLPQQELLARYASVFITHAGMNSVTESVLAGVPMVLLPGVGDQIANARLAASAGVGIAHWELADPYSTCTPALLGRAVQDALGDGPRASCRTLGQRLRSTGGAREAAARIVGLASAGSSS